MADFHSLWSIARPAIATIWVCTYYYFLPAISGSLAILYIAPKTMMNLGLTHRKYYDDGVLDEPEEEVESALMQISAWTSCAFVFFTSCVQVNGYLMRFPERCAGAVVFAAIVVMAAGLVVKASGFVPERYEITKPDEWRRRLDAGTEAALRKAATASCFTYLAAEEKNHAWQDESMW